MFTYAIGAPHQKLVVRFATRVAFAFTCNNIPAAPPAYGVNNISLDISEACGFYKDVLDTWLRQHL